MASVAGFFLHFYQPPRENPWLGLVPNEWSAWPYRDWNERITSECYRAVIAAALPPDEDGGRELIEPLILSSFDVGPTLHHWLEHHAPDVDRAIVHQVRHVARSATAVATAAPYVHAILPLATPRDRALLVAWGIADYRRRYGEAPQGMWLPETAVDLETLETLAAQGIRYTILMASQATRVRDREGSWHHVDLHTLDTSQPYLVRLESGRSMTIVFGHTDLSQRVAFEDLIDDGERLADTMAGMLGDGREGAVLLVTDGETFGHHHRFGDLGLAAVLRRLERHHGLATVAGEWLVAQEPTLEVELASVSAWSCQHGVERWRSDCGCTTGSDHGWNQAWRTPLREALDWLRDTLGGAADEALSSRVTSLEDTLLAYGDVLTGTLGPAEFVAAHASSTLGPDEVTTVLALCEIYRHLLCAFTSCAWFFAEPAEIETAIVLRHAAVAMEHGAKALGLDLEAAFVERLRAVHSNHVGVDGAAIWRLAVEGYRFDGTLVAAGFAAEHLAGGNRARRVRGLWRAEVDSGGAGDGDTFTVTLCFEPTQLTETYEVVAVRTGPLDARIEVRAGPEEPWAVLDLGELGADVTARVAASWLLEPGSEDFEAALELLVAELLERPAGGADDAVLLALAGGQRSVSHSGEASIRRALLAMTSDTEASVDLGMLAPLARAVGVPDLVGDS